MYVSHNTIQAYMKNEQFIWILYWTIEHNSNCMILASDNIEDYMKNE